jgi:DNA-directed RNA polymerase subunit L
MVRQTVSGVIDTAEVTIEIESDDETLANLIYAALKGKTDEINEIVEFEKHPDAAQASMSADWEAYLNDELPK